VIIHRYWTGPDEPPVDGHVWHDDDIPEPLTRWLNARERLCPGDRRHRANMVRWWLLWAHGGLWLDHDATLTGPVPRGDWVTSVSGHVDACVVQLGAGHPLAGAMLDYLQTRTTPGTAPQVSGSRRLQAFARLLGVHEQPLDGWCTHQWITSRGGRGSSPASPPTRRADPPVVRR
jgi:hypothetical protein